MSAHMILLVEDNLVVAKALLMKLQSQGFLVNHVTEAAHAKAAVRTAPPDLIILDIDLPTRDAASPIWDGVDFLEWLHWMNLSIPVIVHSVTAPEKVQERLPEVRAFAYFQKPVHFADLLTAMEAAFVKFPPHPHPPTVSPDC